MLANHQIRHQATCKVGCQTGDCKWLLNLPQEFLWVPCMYGLTYSLYHPRGYKDKKKCNSYQYCSWAQCSLQHSSDDRTDRHLFHQDTFHRDIWPRSMDHLVHSYTYYCSARTRFPGIHRSVCESVQAI